MINKTIGFIGGGRITRIILKGWANTGKSPANITVSDTNHDVLLKLKKEFPNIIISHNDNYSPARAQIIFLALHPPMIGAFLAEIKEKINKSAIFISLAPKISIAQLNEGLGGLPQIVRAIPNAPSIINSGYNPLTFSSNATNEIKKEIVSLLECLGECPIVAEKDMEAYAILSAMGSTYFWFQYFELLKIVESFGLTKIAAQDALKAMLDGTLKVMLESQLSQEEIIDLIPVKPIGEEEECIINIYNNKLKELYQKIRS